jgi:hypothetical protein
MESGNQTPMVERHQTRADQVVAMARRHAEEIRASAEEEAERVLLEAEREAARRHEERARQAEELRITAEREAQRVVLEAEREAARRHEEQARQAEELRVTAEQDAQRVVREAEREAARRREERLEAERRERARLSINKRQIEESLDATVAAVIRIRELIAAFPALESQQPEMIDGVSTASVQAPVPSKGDPASWRNRVMNFIAIGLGVWAVVMIVTLTLLPQTRANADTTAVAATTAVEAAPTGAAAAAVVHAPPEPLVVPPRIVPAAMPPAKDPKAAATMSPGDDQALIVAFVALGDCWISIATDEGTWNERVLKASERHVVRASDVVSFKAGNAGALSVFINDQPTTPLGSEGRVVTRRITRENYRSFLAS